MGVEVNDRFFLEWAKDYAEEIARREADRDKSLDVRSIVMDEIEWAKSAPSSERPRTETLDRIKRVAMRTGYPIDAAIIRYVAERSPPGLDWSTPMFRQRRTENGEQASQARADRTLTLTQTPGALQCAGLPGRYRSER